MTKLVNSSSSFTEQRQSQAETGDTTNPFDAVTGLSRIPWSRTALVYVQ